MRILCLRFTTPLQDSSDHILRFAAWKRHSSTSANLITCRTALTISPSFAAEKRDSCASANQLSSGRQLSYLNLRCLKTQFLNISKSTTLQDVTTHIWTFQDWKRDSWASENRFPCKRHCQYLNFSQPEKVISEYQQTDPLGGWHCSSLTVSQSENAITEHQKFDPLAGRHSPFLKASKPEYAIPEHQQIKTLAGLHHPFLNVSRSENAIP